MIMELHQTHPDARKIKQAVTCLQQGGILIYPTDTVYGLGCSIQHPEAIRRICQLKQLKPEKAKLSFICADLSHLSQFCQPLDTPTFRFVKQHVPGPFTFILPANRHAPKLLRTRQDTVGIRVPYHPVCKALITELGHPVISTSLPGQTEVAPSYPDWIAEHFEHLTDMILLCGAGGIQPSTVVDCTVFPPEILRAGAGNL